MAAIFCVRFLYLQSDLVLSDRHFRRLPRRHLPLWALTWLMEGPTVSLLVAGAFFATGLVLSVFASKQVRCPALSQSYCLCGVLRLIHEPNIGYSYVSYHSWLGLTSSTRHPFPHSLVLSRAMVVSSRGRRCRSEGDEVFHSSIHGGILLEFHLGWQIYVDHFQARNQLHSMVFHTTG